MSNDGLSGSVGQWEGPPGRSGVVQAVLEAAVRLLPVDGGAVLMTTDGARWITAAATDDTIAALVDLEEILGDGPSVDAYRTGVPVLVPDLSEAAVRWRLLASGAPLVAAHFSFPLQIGAVRLGVLDLYRRRPGRLYDLDLRRAIHYADLTADALVDRRYLNALADPASWSALSMPFTAEIDQAAGMVSVILGLDISTAYLRLRAHAFATGLSLAQVAAGVVQGTLELDSDNST